MFFTKVLCANDYEIEEHRGLLMKNKLLCFIFLVPRPALVAVTFNPLSCF